MGSTYRLIWSAEAITNLQGILDYLERRWTSREIKNFVKKLDDNLEFISRNPYLFAESEKTKGIRRCVLSRQTTIYYRIDNKDIKIITLFDNRQNPQNVDKKK